MSVGTELASLGVGQAIVHCNNCGTDLTALIHIACSVCADFDLCLQCFSSGAELGNHKKHHDFTVLDNCTFPVLVNDWGADEELLLLEAVEQHGIGNWRAIAEAVGTKTATEVKEHFEQVNLETLGSHFLPKDFHKSFMETVGGAEKANADEQSPPTPLNIPMEEAKELGYWSRRDDYDYEYMTDAEPLVSNLDVSVADEGLERELKVEHICVYNDHLMKRADLKNAAREHRLFPSLQAAAPKKKKFKREEKDLQPVAPVISRLIKPKEYEDFLESLAKERALQTQIKDLMRYRRLGITSLTGCAQYEEMSLQREVGKGTKASGTTATTAAANSTTADGKSVTDTSSSSLATAAHTPAKPQTSKKLRAVIHLTKTAHLKRGKPDNESKLSRAASYLTSNEQKLCSGLGLSPPEYITVKTIIVRDQTVRKFGVKAKLKHLPQLSSQQKVALIMFFKGHGWV
ncbi:transcriptional adapter 2-beta-like isoform X2 [Sycon ciliatum]|uniref:transcriptional adapter 2-beta-like isoform X2 n=1 Tax=Sycon ciliatum TaxID=27933 RepID=UPI0031F6A6DB